MDTKAIQIQRDERGSYYFIKIIGYFAAKNILRVRSLFEETLSIGHTRVALDLSEVTHIDSMGIGLITNLKRKLDEAQGQFGVINPSEVVEELLSLTNKQGEISIYPQVEDLDTIFD